MTASIFSVMNNNPRRYYSQLHEDEPFRNPCYEPIPCESHLEGVRYLPFRILKIFIWFGLQNHLHDRCVFSEMIPEVLLEKNNFVISKLALRSRKM